LGGGARPQRLFSHDVGRTWPERHDHPPTRTGMPFNVEGNAWIDRDATGRARAILELGWHYAPGKSHPGDDATVVFRRSVAGGRREGGGPWATGPRAGRGSSPAAPGAKPGRGGAGGGATPPPPSAARGPPPRTTSPPRSFGAPPTAAGEGRALPPPHDAAKPW